jgi:hypothetical protein
MVRKPIPRVVPGPFTVEDLTQGLGFLLDWLERTPAVDAKERDKASLVKAMKELHRLLARCYAPGTTAGTRPVARGLKAAKDARIIVNC